ncbi:histidinol-phosphate aminotransferase, chloroplastic-like isoform X2 [Nicotiana sylvestris]|uniref:histidinol-phosphate transaminase n=1 Tax=Nicotiana sylvestris TaxID=4096 RepID=A0A1U7X8X6_NICSY|nr:PREDICTED: histidinol-phosphate aminotransferase, chloroplastic-like isoform X2 [Nicotiana sylvestris]
MGVIEFNTSSICVGRVKTNCLVEKNRTRRIACTASSVPVQEERQQKQCVTGDAFIRPHLRKLSPYQPILPFEVLSTRLGRKPEDIVKLDANENPYGPPPEVFDALGAMRFPYIYPDPESRTLRAALAEDSGLESEYILAGCGADELIDLIMRM